MSQAIWSIIGGGIVGSAMARELMLRRAGKVILFEKEKSLGMHASGRNSGVLHSGINQKPGSLKARMCVEGNLLARKFCRDRGVPIEECGTLVVARNADETERLEQLKRMAEQAGVRGIRIIDKAELLSREPEIEATKALLSPCGAIVDSVGFLNAVAKEARECGATFLFGTEVLAIRHGKIFTSQGDFEAGHIINCAGLYADKIAHMMGVGRQYCIIPFRGDYMEIQQHPIRSMVYQVPDLRFPFLGVHLTKNILGNVIAGPTAVLALGREFYDKKLCFNEFGGMLVTKNFWNLLRQPEFLHLACYNARISFSKRFFLKELRSLCPGINMDEISPYRSGIRAQMVDRCGRMLDDMLVEYRPISTHILNAVSPGMTSSLAFARHVVSTIIASI